LLYRCGSGKFVLFESGGAASGTHTQLAWEVEDIEVVVAELKRRGVVFEEVDVPGLRTVNSIAEVEGNYPSVGIGERGARFRDSEAMRSVSINPTADDPEQSCPLTSHQLSPRLLSKFLRRREFPGSAKFRTRR
jgi:hypothetical protein